MALVMTDGLLHDDGGAWVSYYVLNDELTAIFDIAIIAGILSATTIEDVFEINVPIVDSVTGLAYYLKIANGIIEVALFKSHLDGNVDKFNWEVI